MKRQWVPNATRQLNKLSSFASLFLSYSKRYFDRREAAVVRNKLTTFLVFPDDVSSTSMVRALKAYLDAFVAGERTRLLVLLSNQHVLHLENTKAQIEFALTGAGLCMRGDIHVAVVATPADVDRVVTDAQAVVQIGSAAELAALEGASRHSVPIIAPLPGALRMAYEDALAFAMFKKRWPKIYQSCASASAQHADRERLKPLMDTFYRAYAEYVSTRKIPFEAYLGMRELYYLTNGRISDEMQSIQRHFYSPYRFPHAQGVLGDLNSHDLNEIVAKLHKDSYYVFENRAPKPLCDALMQLARSVDCVPQSPPAPSEQPIRYDESRPISARYNFLEKDLLQHAAVQSLLTDYSILSLVQKYMGHAPVLNILTMWWSTSLLQHADSPSAQLYHVDLDKLATIRFFLYLTDVGPETGPHCIIRGTHKAKPTHLLRDGRYLDEEIHSTFSSDEEVVIGGPRGTMVIADGRALHKGLNLAAGHRLMFQICFSNDLYGQKDNLLPVDNTCGTSFRAFLHQYPRIFARFLDW